MEKVISTVKEAKSVMDNLWISLTLPKTENYAGLNYRLKMDDGSVHKEIFDENNKVYIPSFSTRLCISVEIGIGIEIESSGDDKSVVESMTSQLLKNIMG